MRIGSNLASLLLYAAAFAVYLAVRIPGDRPAAVPGDGGRVDLRGTLAVVAALPGLFALIAFSTINNFLGGVYLALLDAYGLSLMSVQAWGLLWGVLGTGFLIGGLVIARRGLGSDPLRSLLVANVVLWVLATGLTLHRSVVVLAVGMFLYLCVIPFMTTGAGVELIGGWFGTGPDRGIALVFVLTGLVGLAVTLAAFRTRHYRDLSRRYRLAVDAPAPVAPPA